MKKEIRPREDLTERANRTDQRKKNIRVMMLTKHQEVFAKRVGAEEDGLEYLHAGRTYDLRASLARDFAQKGLCSFVDEGKEILADADAPAPHPAGGGGVLGADASVSEDAGDGSKETSDHAIGTEILTK